ncbi:class I SAM-dependent methyltransferase [Stieleria sp. TO1_6]|uniref:methyltransferase regulatory domain-containing protein n=1 Tax=Stieleria tagensis TaxID=2956795 RepID=UPI00209B23D6|nr:methyltransferase regulatory domain-containing protein [Stieleria tagensis]MCO8120432.1 class I SAM-dependent methyltransferase [Stieleria tagensis]
MSDESLPSSSYDQVPYSSYPYSKSHPRNLSALAFLFGMNPPDVRDCRVLEIGCAAGGNLIPVAENFPDVRCLGIDASARQIDDGQKVIADLGLENITLRNQDILEFDPDCGPFDYIICHGVYSWVPPDVQQKILSVCRDQLSPDGVAYISYNTYPGWYLRRGVREMMHYHAEGFEGTTEKIEQSRALLSFLSRAVQSDADAYEKLLHEELNILQACEDSYLFHEHLEDFNEPLFFHQFVSRAESNQLRFLCEAHFSSMFPHEYSEAIRQTLSKIAPNIVQMEQYLDFLRNRKFRQTLLCHTNVSLSRAIDAQRLSNLWVASPISLRQPTDNDADNADADQGCVFEHPTGRSIGVQSPHQQAMLQFLADRWPADTTVDELMQVTWDNTPADQRTDRSQCHLQLCETLLELFSSNLVFLSTCPAACVSTISDRPWASELTRYQAANGSHLTSQRHDNVRLDEFTLAVVRHCDGQTTIEQIADQLRESGIKKNADTSTDSMPTADEFRSAVQTSLNHLLRVALLSNEPVQ